MEQGIALPIRGIGAHQDEARGPFKDGDLSLTSTR
jgi:hypothetical protein